MDWKVMAALGVLAVAIAAGLVVVMYTSVSRYAKRFDPGDAPPGDAGPREKDGRG